MKKYFVLIFLIFISINCRENKQNFATEYFPILLFEEFQIFSPKSGDIWKIGETYEIKWKPSSRAKFVKIELYRKNLLRRTISEKTENDGSFLFTIPLDSEISNLFRIKLINYHDPEEFVFSSYFSIR